MKKTLCLLCSLCFPVILTAALQHTYTFNAAKQPYYRNTTLGFGYMNVLYHPKSKLEMPEGSMLQVATLNYLECLIECARNLSCFSINFGRQPIFIYQGDVQYLCQLLPTDKYNFSSNYQINNQEFDHYSIKSDCNNSPCLHNFTCIPNYVKDTYECLCPRPPFEGQHCKDVNECSAGLHNCHSSLATCINTVGSFNCQCIPGYQGNGVTCSDVNECTAGTDNCHVNATCTNTVGTFTCQCNPEYAGDGVTCTDPDCDFEGGMCGWTTYSLLSFDWKRIKGSTLSGSTGPTGDATASKNGLGYYIYTEATWGEAGEKTELRSPVFTPTSGRCLNFAYHMYGSQMGSLKLYVVNAATGSKNLMFSKSGNQGTSWFRQQQTITSASEHKIVFEVTKGSGYKGDAALDDIIINEGICT